PGNRAAHLAGCDLRIADEGDGADVIATAQGAQSGFLRRAEAGDEDCVGDAAAAIAPEKSAAGEDHNRVGPATKSVLEIRRANFGTADLDASAQDVGAAGIGVMVAEFGV